MAPLRLRGASDASVRASSGRCRSGICPFTPVPGGENPYQHPTLGNPSKKRFTSYDRSDATGLDYAVNRFYSPQQGRFTQGDPIGMGAASLGDPQSLNMYAYCGNDPINHVDPYGLFSPRIIIDGVRSVGGMIIPRMVLIVIREVLIRGSGGSSRSGAQTPPTFPPGAPSISLGDILSKIGIGIGVNVDPRTPPFVLGTGVGGVNNFSQFKKIIISKQVYDTAEEAAIAALRFIIRQSIKIDREYAGRICKRKSDGKFIYTGPYKGKQYSSNPYDCPADTEDAGYYHTHGAYEQKYDFTKQGGVDTNEVFNEQDRSRAAAWGTPAWLGTPKGRILKFTPQRGQTLSPGVAVKGVTEELTKKYGNLLSK